MVMVVALEGNFEGEFERRLVVGVERERERERRMDEETEVEEDNIDPLVAPPLLAQPTPSLYYPPSLRFRFPTYRTPTTSRNSQNYPGRARALSCIPREGLSKKERKARNYSYIHRCIPCLSCFLTFLLPPLFRSSSHVERIETENNSRRSVAVATEDRGRFPENFARTSARAKAPLH